MYVLTIQFSSMEHDEFQVPYLSYTILEATFHRQTVKTVAYLRVSTAQQDLRSQRLAILEYARKHDFRIDDFIETTASGQASEKRRRLDELMSVLQRGDRLVVSELSRAWPVAGSDRRHPRRPRQGRHRLRRAQGEHPRRGRARHPDQGHDHALRAVRRGRAGPDLRTHPRGSRQGPEPRAGSSAARRARWASHGSMASRDDIRRFLELGVSRTAIAKITGVSRTTLYSFMSTRGLRPSS